MAPQQIVDTPVKEIHGIVDAAAAKAEEMKNLSLTSKIDLLKQIKHNLIHHIDEWASDAYKARGRLLRPRAQSLPRYLNL